MNPFSKLKYVIYFFWLFGVQFYLEIKYLL